MKKYLSDSIQYPFVATQLKKEGKVAVQFKVDVAGKISEAKVKQSADYFLDKEALRVVSTMPDWTPGAKCDQKLNILVTMPVVFKLALPAAEKGWERNDKTIILLDGERMPSSFDLNWLNYANLASYKVLQPGDKAVNKKLVSEYGKDAVNGVVLIETNKKEFTE
jgi:TonB family protein